MKFGHTTASLLIAKLHASSRQSTLAKALHEYGRLIGTRGSGGGSPPLAMERKAVAVVTSWGPLVAGTLTVVLCFQGSMVAVT